MKNNLIKRVTCMAVGHDYRVVREITSTIVEYECMHCKKKMTSDAQGNFVTLTPRLRELNEMLLSKA